jgi:hypothetical protein
MAVILALVEYHDAIFEDQKNNNNNNNNHYDCSLGILTRRNKNFSNVREKISQLCFSLSLNKMQNKSEGDYFLL